jgi:hypothetical protein
VGGVEIGVYSMYMIALGSRGRQSWGGVRFIFRGGGGVDIRVSNGTLTLISRMTLRVGAIFILFLTHYSNVIPLEGLGTHVYSSRDCTTYYTTHCSTKVLSSRCYCSTHVLSSRC